jgi:hypothetical protein
MTPEEYILMRELERELNRGCPSGFRLSASERERVDSIGVRPRVRTAEEDEFFRRINRHGIKKGKLMEIIFTVEETEEGFIAQAIGQSIFTQAETKRELRAQIRDAVKCHFDGLSEFNPLPPPTSVRMVKEIETFNL